jgi:peptidyl-prolyl cis-trans isomerase A (cyclophilin A)
MMKIVIAGALVAVLAPLSLRAQATHKTAPRSTAQHTTTGAHSLLQPSSLNDKAPDVFKAKFTTTRGDFVVEVHRDWSPYGADRFYNLVKYGFYTDASFFRVISGFMVQFGIAARPAVAGAWANAAIPDDPVKQSNRRGYVTFATAGPRTRTTQVFINFGDNSRLDSDGFSPFGRVIGGMEVVDKLYSGYGEGAPQGNGPSQDRLTKEGKPYIDKNFPKLDSIKSASIVP